MKRRISVSLMVGFVLTMSSFLHTTSPVKKPWTFFVYLAGVNSLHEFAYGDLAEMMKVGSTDNVNVIVYFSILKDDGTEVTIPLYVEKGKVTPIGSPVVADSGDVQTLKNGLALACTAYPSDFFAVVLWNHGGGSLNRRKYLETRAICYDDLTNHYLSDRDCLAALSWAKDTYRNGKNIDIVACDACLMAGLEFAYTLMGCVDYMVMSQETIPGDGFDYARVLSYLNKAVPTPYVFSKNIVTAYQQEYAGTTDYTLSAIDAAKLKPLVETLNQIATKLIAPLSGSNQKAVRSYLKKSYTKALTFDDGTYCDMRGFFSALKEFVPHMGLSKKDATTLTGLLKTLDVQLNRCIMQKTSSTSYKKASGLSFYFPSTRIDHSYYDLYWTEKNPAVLQLLESYLK